MQKIWKGFKILCFVTNDQLSHTAQCCSSVWDVSLRSPLQNTRSLLIGQLTHAWDSTANTNRAAVLNQFIHAKPATRNGRYFTICDIPPKKFPKVRICHLAVITINSSWWFFFNFIVVRFTLVWWHCMRPRTRSSLLNEAPARLSGTGLVTISLTWSKTLLYAEFIKKNGDCKGNTTNLFHHLKHQHKPEYDESQKMRTDTAEATASTSAKASGKKTLSQKKIGDAFNGGSGKLVWFESSQFYSTGELVFFILTFIITGINARSPIHF